MKIVNETQRPELTEYHVGNVILQGSGVYQIVRNGDSYLEIDLETGCTATAWYDTLEELFKAGHVLYEKLVTATLTIE
ncbi:hypothetical protein MUDAN_BIHEEGNE_03209 [Lactiplantibacillus mudanjiangensis]|uniref:hypothetical protein n=1 Tax=Lactiplantibacillus mudanjiangensis TaxID=1296538 RepID=UPI0010153ABF|nr:hypothetical protein MUDAN_BIHEEGNE_03209 [Lactiplantibacillus mudanjiangensis]